jgi:hypothetical protein
LERVSDQEAEVKGMSPGVIPGFRNVRCCGRQSQERSRNRVVQGVVWMARSRNGLCLEIQKESGVGDKVKKWLIPRRTLGGVDGRVKEWLLLRSRNRVVW